MRRSVVLLVPAVTLTLVLCARRVRRARLGLSLPLSFTTTALVRLAFSENGLGPAVLLLYLIRSVPWQALPWVAGQVIETTTVPFARSFNSLLLMRGQWCLWCLWPRLPLPP